MSEPNWLSESIQYKTFTGSFAYGTNQLDSDHDIKGFCIPPQETLFEYLNTIGGFKKYKLHATKYNLDIYNIVYFLKLCLRCNPNIVDVLFTPSDCLLTCTPIATLVRQNRNLFICKKYFIRTIEFGKLQLRKLQNCPRSSVVEKYGWDTKYGYHLFRYFDQAEQIIFDRDINLRRNSDLMNEIRNGKVNQNTLLACCTMKEALLNSVFYSSNLPEEPDRIKVKKLLLECIKVYFENERHNKTYDSIIKMIEDKVYV